MEKTYLTLAKIDAYMIAYNLSNYVWGVVLSWENFPKWTVGKQYTEAVDSISANLAEGFGRYHKKDKIHFTGLALARWKRAGIGQEKQP
jgi:four helix bundle protein